MKLLGKLLSYSRRRSKGQGILELALIFPFLFIFLYAISEFSVLLVQNQRVTALSREAAGAIFYQCAGLEDSKLSTCVQGIANQVAAQGGAILPDFASRGHIIISVFEPDSSGSSVQLTNTQELGSGAGSTSYGSDSFDSSFVKDNGMIVVGEVFYKYETITPLQVLLQSIQLPQNMYEATVF